MNTTEGRTRQDSGHCHCGSPMHGTDHCPCCGCEQHEKVCDWTCRHPRARSIMTHSDKCWEGK